MDGKYESVSNENLVEYLKAFGGAEEEAKQYANAKVVINFKKEGDKYTYTSESPFGTNTVTFEPGKEFNEKIAGKVELKSVAKVDGNKITINSTTDRGSLSRVYDLQGDQVVVTMTGPQGITAKRVYKKL